MLRRFLLWLLRKLEPAPRSDYVFTPDDFAELNRFWAKHCAQKDEEEAKQFGRDPDAFWLDPARHNLPWDRWMFPRAAVATPKPAPAQAQLAPAALHLAVDSRSGRVYIGGTDYARAWAQEQYDRHLALQMAKLNGSERMLAYINRRWDRHQGIQREEEK